MIKIIGNGDDLSTISRHSDNSLLPQLQKGGASMPDRVIFHADCNNFFASCECLERPELKDVPMAVAGDPEDRLGVVVAKNELAKKRGVKTTDTVWQAKKKCPGIVFVPPRHRYYKQKIGRAHV